jgi:putative resolvase
VTEKDVAIYARCCTQNPAEDLARQHERLVEACRERGYRIVLDCSEIASTLNDNRRQFFKIIDAACKGEVKKVVIEQRDRLTRYGFRTIERFFKGVGCTVEVLEEAEGKSEPEELVEDLLTIMGSCRSSMYGARDGRKRTEDNDAAT